MENLAQPLSIFKCRKVIMYEFPCINVLSIETSSCLNVKTEPMMKWCGDGETEPMEDLHLGNGISVSAIMKKLKWQPFPKYASCGKFSNSVKVIYERLEFVINGDDTLLYVRETLPIVSGTEENLSLEMFFARI